MLLLARQVKALVKGRPLESLASTETKPWLVLPEQSVPVQMTAGKIQHQGLAMQVDDVLIRTSGAVGLDQSIDLVAEVPIRDEWVSENRYFAALRGQSLRVPIRGTITLGRRAGSGLPTFDTHFFEFVEREQWDRGEPEFLTLDCLRKGRDYYIIVTTPSGLYRYFINDLVRVTGFLHAMPLLKFLQKGKGVTNITGEKLYEAQVVSAVNEAMAQAALDARFVMMLADEEARRYCLYIEAGTGNKLTAGALAHAVDAKLQALNVEYHAKRESGRLGAPEAVWLAAGTGEAYKKFCVEQGQREGQFKWLALAYRRTFAFDLDAHREQA